MTHNADRGPLLNVSEAQQRMLAAFNPLSPETVTLAEAAGRVLAGPITALFDLPPFSNSSMDGFAIRAIEVAAASSDQPATLRVVADLPAGIVSGVMLQDVQAVRIMTGAPVPDGADAVIPVEDTDFQEPQPGTAAPKDVKIYRPVRAGENVRPQGQDVKAGEVVLQPGYSLRPQDIGFLAMLGKGEVSVRRLPRVAVFSSGDELLPVDIPLTAGKIHDSNTHTLISMIEKYGGRFINFGIVPDKAEAVQSILDRAVNHKVDMILSSAGVSVGAFDFVRSVVEQHGHLNFWKVNMRPGKPLAFGDYKDIPFVGLPGNPVSAFVGFEVFVRPALLKMAGQTKWDRPAQSVELLDPVESDGRESYLRGIVEYRDGQWFGLLTGHQGSGNLRSLVQANALLLIPSGVKSLPAGARVNAWLLDSP